MEEGRFFPPFSIEPKKRKVSAKISIITSKLSGNIVHSEAGES